MSSSAKADSTIPVPRSAFSSTYSRYTTPITSKEEVSKLLPKSEVSTDFTTTTKSELPSEIKSVDFVSPSVPSEHQSDSKSFSTSFKVDSMSDYSYKPPSTHSNFYSPAKTIEPSFDFVKLAQAMNVKSPYLADDMSKASMKSFLNAYRKYKVQCATIGSPIKPLHYCLLPDQLELIADVNGLELDELLSTAYSDDDMIKFMAAIHRIDEPVAASRALMAVKMSSDDLSLTTLRDHNRNFDFELLCVGKKLSSQRKLQCYVSSLRPKLLNETVFNMSPSDIEEAQQYAQSAIKSLRETKLLYDQMKAPSPGDQPSKPPSKKDNQSHPKPGQNSQSSKPSSNLDLSKIKCFKCLEMGHFANKCVNPRHPDAPKPSSAPSSSAKPSNASHNSHKPTSRRLSVVPTNDNADVPPSRVQLFSSQLLPSASEPSPSVDEFIRIPVAIMKSTDSHQVISETTVFADTGANINTIRRPYFNDLLSLGTSLSISSGPSLTVKLPALQRTTISGDHVFIPLMLLLETPVVVSEKFYILEDCDENISFSLPTIRSLGLADYVHAQLSADPPEDSLYPVEDIQPWPVEPNDTLDSTILQELDINPSFPKLDALQSILLKHRVLFSPLDSVGLQVPPMEITLKPGVIPRPLPCRYISPRLLEQVKIELDKLIDMGILVRTKSTLMASPLVIVPKPDGNIRLAVDYRSLNELIEYEAATIPYQKQLFPCLQNRQYYGKVDNEWGFYQLRLAENSRSLTTINTPWGLFEFTSCPFGVSTAPGIYQDRMANIILQPYFMQCCVVYIDDTIIYGDDADSFLLHLDRVLSRMVQYNVRLKAKKCSFGYPEVAFLGHLFNALGYRLTDDRKQGIVDLSPPSTLKQLRSFLGMVNYFRDFIPHLSDLLSPLTELTKTSKYPSFQWSSAAQSAFESVKAAVLQSQSLCHFSDDDDTFIFCDASTIGIGATLMQRQNGVMVPICFLSQKFSDAAVKWATIVQECYAILYAVTTWSSYLLGRHFFIYTDHRNLVYLSTSTIPKLVRWRLRLMEFSFTIIHVAGADNVIADGLSRLFRGKAYTVPDDFDSSTFLPSIHNSIVGHHGITNTLALLNSANISWPNFKAEVTDFISSCPVCQKVKHQPAPDLPASQYHLHGSSPMSSLSLDTIGPLPEDESGFKYILVVIDNFSKFVMLYPTVSTTAMSYVQSLIHHIGLFGVMKFVRTDGGTQFTADVCKELSALLKFDHLVVVPYHPEGNGLVERRNAEVMKHLRALVLDRRVAATWSSVLPLVQRILNTTYDRSINTYPSKILFGDMLPVRFPLVFDNVSTSTLVSEYLNTLSSNQELLISLSQKYLDKQAKSRLKVNDAAPTNSVSFNVGDYVLVTYPTRPPNKLSSLYRGPMIIIDKIRDDMFKLNDLISNKDIQVHIDRLRLFKVPDDFQPSELIQLAAADKDEFIVESIIDHTGTTKRNLQFRVRWQGYDPSEDSWLSYNELKDNIALDVYSHEHPELKLG